MTQDLDNLKNDLCDVEAMETEAAERNAKLVIIRVRVLAENLC